MSFIHNDDKQYVLVIADAMAASRDPLRTTERDRELSRCGDLFANNSRESPANAFAKNSTEPQVHILPAIPRGRRQIHFASSSTEPQVNIFANNSREPPAVCLTTIPHAIIVCKLTPLQLYTGN